VEFTVLETAEEVAAAAAGEIAGAIGSGAARTLVLAGGSTPRRCYELLADIPGVAWGRVTVLFGDERCVPANHADSNYRMAREALLDRVAPATVHRSTSCCWEWGRTATPRRSFRATRLSTRKAGRSGSTTRPNRRRNA
jgi:6-phosphogluconolactonase/glucosamine-6-phosphate isomerase/deaminase